MIVRWQTFSCYFGFLNCGYRILSKAFVYYLIHSLRVELPHVVQPYWCWDMKGGLYIYKNLIFQNNKYEYPKRSDHIYTGEIRSLLHWFGRAIYKFRKICSDFNSMYSHRYNSFPFRTWWKITHSYCVLRIFTTLYCISSAGTSTAR